MSNIKETDRLLIYRFTEEDTAFILELLNSPGWIEFIGDRNIKTAEDALNYLENGPLKSYAENGFGAWILIEKATGRKVGSCGLYKREILDYPDVGYALLPEFEGLGYASEAVLKVLEIASSVYKLNILNAITTKENLRSVALLEKSGFTKTGQITWPETEEILQVFTYRK